MLSRKTIMTALLMGTIVLPAGAYAAEAGVAASPSASATVQTQAKPGLFGSVGSKVRGLFGTTAQTRAQAQARADADAQALAARRAQNDNPTTYDSASGSLRSTDSIDNTDDSIGGSTTGSVRGSSTASGLTGIRSNNDVNARTQAGVNADIESSAGTSIDTNGAAGPLGSESSMGAAGGTDLSTHAGGGIQ